ncbi:MAG: hypothetical protein QW063_00435 [Candidatus Nanoarchaeia archaeon]
MKSNKKGIEIGLSYIIMIALGVIGIILVLWIFRGGFSEVSAKLIALLNQTKP